MPRPWRRRRSPGFSGARCGCSRSVRCWAVSRSARPFRSARCWPPRYRATKPSRGSPRPRSLSARRPSRCRSQHSRAAEGAARRSRAGWSAALAGVLLVILAAAVGSFPLLLVAFGLVGAAQAANLQTRFAAADLATDATRGRDLSLVVWATTIGAVLGPNLTGPGEMHRPSGGDAAPHRAVPLHHRGSAAGRSPCTSSGCVRTRCCSRSG